MKNERANPMMLFPGRCPLRWAWAVGAVLLAVGCDGRPVQTPKPATRPTATSVPAVSPSSGTGDATPPPAKPVVKDDPKPAVPKRPEPGWTVFRAAFDDKADATCEARFTGGNRLDVDTQNISHLTIDLGKLPEGAPKSGPWNLQIDGQGIEVSGSRGRYLHLIRGKAGAWDVDRAAYR